MSDEPTADDMIDWLSTHIAVVEFQLGPGWTVTVQGWSIGGKRYQYSAPSWRDAVAGAMRETAYLTGHAPRCDVEAESERLRAVLQAIIDTERCTFDRPGDQCEMMQETARQALEKPQTIAQQLGSEDAPPMKFYQLPVGARFVFTTSGGHPGSFVCVKNRETAYTDEDGREIRKFDRETDWLNVMIVED